MCMELGMHLRFAFARLSSTLRGQVGYISVSLTHGQPSECSVLCSCWQLREIPILLPFVVHSLIRQTFKAFLSTQAGGFGGPCGLLTLLEACHSGEGGLITRLGLGLGLCLGGLNRGPRLAESTVGHCHLTASLCHGDIFVWSARHYHSPNIRGVAGRRHPSATLGVSRLSTAGVAA